MPAPVVNKFATATWLCMEGLDILLNNLNIAAKFNTDYNSEFTKPFPVGSTVQVPLPWRPSIRTGITYAGQPIEKRHTSVTVDQVFGVDFEWGSVEKALEMSRGRDKIKAELLDPAMAKIAQEIESRAALYAYQHASLIVGALGTNPASFDAAFGAANQAMTELGIGLDGRSMTLAPKVARALRNSAVSYFNPADQISKMFKKGIIGTVDGMETFESMSLYDHTAGVWAGAVTVNGANQSGSSLTITATAGDTFNVGDVFSILNVNPTNPMTGRKASSTARQFRVTEALTAAGGGADVLKIAPPISGPGTTYQNVDALPSDGAALTLFPGTTAPSTGPKAGAQNLAMTRDAFALVGVPLENPKDGSVEMVAKMRDPNSGIEIAFVRAFDPIYRRWINRFDLLMGFGTLYADDGACVRVLSA